MATVVPGRMTAEVDGDFVVFMIGMRINKPWKLHKWIPVMRAMTPMIRTLMQRKDLGLLCFRAWVGPTGPLLVQYWRSVEQLESFARASDLPHSAAWRAFNKKVGGDGDVGIWHETYVVRGGSYEAVYGNMPRTGLASAGRHVSINASTFAANRRAHNAGVETDQGRVGNPAA
jgi:Monooxygenase af470-like